MKLAVNVATNSDGAFLDAGVSKAATAFGHVD